MPRRPGRRNLPGTGLLLCLLLAAAPAWGWETGLEVQRHVLENGLTLLMVERHDAPVVAAVITVRVGGVDEPLGQTGIAHLFEHMAFKGTRSIGTRDAAREARLLDEMDHLVAEREQRLADGAPPDSLAALDARIEAVRTAARELVEPNAYGNLYLRQGAVGLNASTGYDTTSYVVQLPANRLPFWAAMESGRLAHPVLREFYVERDVVMEERRTRVDTSPSGRLWEVFQAVAFTAHPYARPVIGWPDDLIHITRPDAEAFYNTHYVPANMVVALVGDLDPDATLHLVRRTFGRLPARPPARANRTQELEPAGERRVILRGDAGPEVAIGYLRPGLTHPDDAAFEVLGSVLAEGRTSRLYRTLVLEQEIATTVSTASGPGTVDPHLFVVSATPRQPHTPAEVEAAVLAELERLQTEPVTERELERARNQVEAATVRQMEDNPDLARTLAYFEAVADGWDYPMRLLDRIAALTPKDIGRVAETYLTPHRRVVAERLRETPNSDATPPEDPS